jgi:phage gp16-like protein
MDEMFENWAETKEALLEGLAADKKRHCWIP